MKYPKSKSPWYLNVYHKKKAKHILVNCNLGSDEKEAITRAEELCKENLYNFTDHTITLVRTEVILIGT